MPEAGVLSLATMLSAIVVPEAAIKWAMVAHVMSGMIGTFLLIRRVPIDGRCAAVGALAFGLNPVPPRAFPRRAPQSHPADVCSAVGDVAAMAVA